MSETFVNSTITIIQTIATIISRSLCSKYRKRSKIEDYTHDLILYMIENMGDLEKNLGDTDDWIEITRKKVYVYLKYKIIQELNLDSRTYRFEKKGHNVIYEVEPEDTNLDVEGDAIATTKKNEISWDEVCKCIGLIKKYVEEGEDKLVALKKVQNDMNINAETLLYYMNLYGIRQGESDEVKTQNKAEKRNSHEYHWLKNYGGQGWKIIIILIVLKFNTFSTKSVTREGNENKYENCKRKRCREVWIC